MRKPELADVVVMHDCKPVYNRIENNVYCALKTSFIDREKSTLDSWLTIFNDNKEAKDCIIVES